MSGILLDTLKDELDPLLVELLVNDLQLRNDSEVYLLDLLINDDLLSTDSYTTTTNIYLNKGATNKRNLTEEIAELDLQNRQINVELSSITNNNRDLIIDISKDLKLVDEQLHTQLINEIDHALQLVNKDVAPDKDTNKSSTHEKFSININERLGNSIKINNSILSNIDSVLDILELPAICKLCILHGNYQEALEISMLAQTLVIRFPKLVTFQKILHQVEQELELMVRGLIKLLNTNLKQNNILKIFQILNKPDLINYSSSLSKSTHNHDNTNNTIDKSLQKDRFLKMIYLNARFKFITNEISNLKPIINFNKQTYLKRFIEIYREFIFNSLSIYHAIFNSTSLKESTNSIKQEDKILVRQFIKNLVSLLCQELKSYLPDIVNTALYDDQDDLTSRSQKDGIILQMLYLCKSLSKYGVDFENILVWELCFNDENPLITEADWLRNLDKVNKFKFQ